MSLDNSSAQDLVGDFDAEAIAYAKKMKDEE